ncbi:YfhO family protein [Salimicrobium halophilum]|uniref:Uncharacterized membrane protein YfhO n=1 Tax=Salimicrobium halophilum TaxID=86666 RepID=A0A1G8R446_9BACI|nr:YfhO family protein [Salimicrobium halophilum]SDJ11739.1 Uncharacterized membrane protein YfhO [Salimicrobium halophilum]
MRNKKTILLLISSLLVATLAHGYFIYQWTQGIYMTGPNDGLSQMVPFRDMLYDQFTSGDFFYSYEFGLGGDTYSQLAYYYSINLFFYATVLIVFLMETLNIIDSPDILFWAQSSVFISIMRMTFVLMITTYVFRYINGRTLPAFLGAVFYATAAKYYHHVTYWEFFGDAFLWLPLLILGVEKVIREGKPGWLILAVAISFFDNFYFAYINGFFTGVYILFRWLIPLLGKEVPKLQQLKLYAISVVLGFGVGAVGFIPAVRGFLQNERPAYEQEIPLFEATTNILYDSLYLIVPALFVVMLLLFRQFKSPAFLFFSVLSLLFIALHYIPYAASFFNGLSAPQHRYEYLASFTIGGAIAAGFPLLKHVKIKNSSLVATGTIVLYAAFLAGDPTLSFNSVWAKLILTSVLLTLLLIFLTQRYGTIGWYGLFSVTILIQLVTMNVYQHYELYAGGEVHESSRDYILSNNYVSSEQQNLIDSSLDASFPRVTWMADGRYNTPLIQDFQGTSAYSSILNGDLLNYYYHDLEIDMKRESVSRYSGFGDRANLHSLWRSNHVLRKIGNEYTIPYGFEQSEESENYVTYENTNPLPFVRLSDVVYSEESLADRHFLSREQAMLEGIVVEDGSTTAKTVPEHENFMSQVQVKSVGATYSEDQLVVTEDQGGIDLQLPEKIMESSAEDIYVSFYLFNNVKEAPLFGLEVNDFQTSRKSRDSIYKTGVNDITIRVPKEKLISLRVPKGDYTLNELEMYAADYDTLEQVSGKEEQPNAQFNGNRITIESIDTEKDSYLSIPIPYEKGWSVEVDGETREVEKVNYAMIGTKIEPGDNEVEFVYRPPYFFSTLVAFSVSLFMACLWIWKRKKTGKQ